MYCILSKTDDIFFNLAVEDYLLRNRTENYMMLWQSLPAVVVGKHQNAVAEINSEYVETHGIIVARRLSGGGAVYHDKGNLNFTFILNGEKNKLVDFKQFVNPIIKFINQKGAPAVAGKRHDILIDGYKISGNAEHVFKTRILHHGTLLFDADLDAINHSLSAAPGRYIDKAIRSNRSVITNLAGYLKNISHIHEFTAELWQYLRTYYVDTIIYELKESEIKEIQKLRDEKYANWEWIYAYSPSFELEKNIEFKSLNFHLHLKVARGIIQKIEIVDNSHIHEIAWLSEKLIFCRFEYAQIKHLLKSTHLEMQIIDHLLKELF